MKKGFTLIELLAVIVILAVILAIAVPSISNVIENSKKSSFQSNAEMVITALEYKKLENDTFDPTTVTEANMATTIGISGDNYNDLSVSIVDNKINVLIIGAGQFDGFRAVGSKKNITVTKIGDTTAPVITITGSNPVNVNQGSTYTDAGATATDNKDGNITPSIQVTNNVNTSVIGTYTVTYTVSDSSFNQATATRTVNVRDTVAPVITITGSNPASVNKGATYTDAGATATDNLDGNVTSSIQTTSTVNASVAGTYTVTYSVTDSSGNNATLTRTVKVLPTSPYNYAYTGSLQTFTVPVSGTYKLEVWGAQGGDISGKLGGKGGYAVGNISLTNGQTISIYVGGAGANNTAGWNGGGSSTATYNTGGGGGTDMRLTGTALTDRVIVAGGGGGATYADANSYAAGGNAGGTSGSAGANIQYANGGGGGTQAAGGAAGTYTVYLTYNGRNGLPGDLGLGGNSNLGNAGGGGGGGYYGGGSGGVSGYWGVAGGGGGSSYVGTLSSASTIGGGSSMTAPGGSAETGHAGNGYARITFIN